MNLKITECETLLLRLRRRHRHHRRTQQSIFSACLFPLLNVSSFIHKNDGNSAQFSCKWIPTDDYIYFCERWNDDFITKRAKTAPTLKNEISFTKIFHFDFYNLKKIFFMNETQDFTALIPSNLC